MRQIYVIGLNHETSKIQTREVFARVFVSSQHIKDVLGKILHLHETVLLSTCNRVEMYIVMQFDREIPSFSEMFSKISSHLSNILQITKSEFYLLQCFSSNHFIGG